MTPERRSNTALRESLLKLLSDDEVAKVATEETAAQLNEGDEFVDLEHPDHGVLKADGVVIDMDNVLPRKNLQPKTWSQIVSLLKH